MTTDHYNSVVDAPKSWKGNVAANGFDLVGAGDLGCDSINGTALGALVTDEYPLTGDLGGTLGAPTVSHVGGLTASSVATAANLANAATSANTTGAIVKRDGSGGFSAGLISASAVLASTLSTSALAVTGTSLLGSMTQLGGASASFPALKRSATTAKFRLADDSADAPVTAAGAIFSGNVGIGVTTAFPQLQVGDYGSIATNSTEFNIAKNLYNNGSNWVYLNTAAGALVNMTTAGDVVIWTTPSGTVGTNATMNRRVTIKEGGNVGIGVSSPGYLVDVNGPMQAAGEFIASTISPYGQFRAISGNYGFFVRNDGSNTYFMVTASGDQYGVYSSLRPFQIGNASGDVTIGNGILYAKHGDRLYMAAPSTAPTDGLLGADQISIWINESTNQLTFRAKYGSGTLKTGTIALT